LIWNLLRLSIVTACKTSWTGKLTGFWPKMTHSGARKASAILQPSLGTLYLRGWRHRPVTQGHGALPAPAARCPAPPGAHPTPLDLASWTWHVPPGAAPVTHAPLTMSPAPPCDASTTRAQATGFPIPPGAPPAPPSPTTRCPAASRCPPPSSPPDPMTWWFDPGSAPPTPPDLATRYRYLERRPDPPLMAAASPTVLLILLFYCPIPKIVAKYNSTRMTSVFFIEKCGCKKT
jgi:hypothetical protein